jgi:hypothetical protein
MGEASISQLRIWAHALPTLVTHIGWYASLPEDVVAHVRMEHESADIKRHLNAFLSSPGSFAEMGERGRRLLDEEHSVERYVEAVLDLAVSAQEFRPRAVAYQLAERVGISVSPWADALVSDEELHKAAEEIFILTNGNHHSTGR